MYHKVGACPNGALVPHHYVGTARFERQIRALVKFGFQTIKLHDVLNHRDTVSKPICLTFDDGYENFATEAVPILKQQGQTATVFVVSGLIGNTNEWDTKLGDQPERLMSPEKILELDALGFEFGSHSVTHARLTKVNQNEATQEICESQKNLAELLSKPIDTFCYPYGSHNEAIRRIVQNCGYKLACSVEKGWNHETTDPYRLKRINVRSDTSTPILFWKLWRQSLLESTEK